MTINKKILGAVLAVTMGCALGAAAQAPDVAKPLDEAKTDIQKKATETEAQLRNAPLKVLKVDKDKQTVEFEAQLSPKAKVMQDGKAIGLDQIKEGDEVRASFDPKSNEILRLDVVKAPTEKKDMEKMDKGEMPTSSSLAPAAAEGRPLRRHRLARCSKGAPMDHERRIDERLAQWGLTREDDSPLTPAASKNRTLVCRHGRSRRVLVKVADGPPSHSGVVREGEVLSRLSALTRAGCPLSLPRLFAFDRALGLVAVEWLAPSETLHTYHRRTRRYGAGLARRLGRAVGFLHRVSRERSDALGPRADLCEEADLLECFLRMRPEFYARLSLAGVDLFSAVQADPGAVLGLQRLSEACAAEGSVLLHGDLKQANLLRVTRRNQVSLVLLDWELSAWGDPARDLGGVIADYALGALAPERPNEVLPPPSLRRTLRALLRSYAGERGRDFTFDEALEQRVARWAGASLLFYVYGMTHYEGELSERGRDLVGHATHMLAEPEQWPALLWGTA